MTKSTTKSNCGGRKTFKRGSEVRILTVDGKISKNVFRVDPLKEDDPEYTEYVKSDRKGLVKLQGNNESIQVLFRRILPTSIDGQAPVIDSGGKHFTICPECGDVLEVNDPQQANCNICSQNFQLYWLGVKPMSQTNPETPVVEATAPESTPEAASPETTQETKPTTIKVKRPAQNERKALCLDTLAKLDNCELWTKNGVKFDHANVDVKSHALIFTGENPRKYCFNTYDGSLGKKAKDLMVKEFVADEAVGEKKPWHPIKDLTKHKEDLEKKGYKLHS
jgi:hypothetical protein